MTPLFQKIAANLIRFTDRPALVANAQSHSYGQLHALTAQLQSALRRPELRGQKIIGIATNDDLQTYAAILALWFEGRAYVPINPAMPQERNANIIGQAGIRTVIGYYEHAEAAGLTVLESAALPPPETFPEPLAGVPDSELAYILFTSGTTGVPKGVPITRGNLNAFIHAMDQLEISFDEQDRCLQMFELTFDFSVVAYVWPFSRGAAIYTIPKDRIKYGYIYELIEEERLSVLFLVPSVLKYLQPHFDEFENPRVRYSIFCGEALTEEITNQWSRCIPEMEIYNFYGPTECTVFCTWYRYRKSAANKAHNGILSIGRAMKGTETLLIDEAGEKLNAVGEVGELCLTSVQLTPGYWQDEVKNAATFFTLPDGQGTEKRYYKTGDVCRYDAEGDLFYLGRSDSQVKVQGFRIELSEIEHALSKAYPGINVAALAFQNAENTTEIGAVFEGTPFATERLFEELKTHLPVYMIPTQVAFEPVFPLNLNGKTDRKKLTEKFQNL